MTSKRLVHLWVRYMRKKGLTIPEFLEIFPKQSPPAVYLAFTKLDESKEIVSNGLRSGNTVWAAAKDGKKINYDN